MKLEDFEIGDKVQVLVTNPKIDKQEWRDGVVENKGLIYPNSRGVTQERFTPYPKFTVKYIHTYYHTQEGVTVWDNDGIPHFEIPEPKFYDKENSALFFMDGTIKKVENEVQKTS